MTAFSFYQNTVVPSEWAEQVSLLGPCNARDHLFLNTSLCVLQLSSTSSSSRDQLDTSAMDSMSPSLPSGHTVCPPQMLLMALTNQSSISLKMKVKVSFLILPLFFMVSRGKDKGKASCYLWPTVWGSHLSVLFVERPSLSTDIRSTFLLVFLYGTTLKHRGSNSSHA